MAIDLQQNLLISTAKLVPTVVRLMNMACFYTARAYRAAHFENIRLAPGLSSLSNYSVDSLDNCDNEILERMSSTFSNRFQQNEMSSSILSNQSFIPPSKISDTDKSPVLWEKNFDDIVQNKHLINDPFSAWLEQFVKVTINYKISFKKSIPVTTKTGKIEHYKIHRKIASNGLLAFALKPAEKNSSLSPLIVFRATETNIFAEEALASMQNDLDARMGERGWMASQKEFTALMEDPEFRNPDEKVKVAGYSLGGAHAQYFILDHFTNVSYGCFYNNPSVHADVAEEFARRINEEDLQDRLVLQIFRTDGDLFHLFGSKHLGCGVNHPSVSTQLLEIRYPAQQMFDLSLHSRRIFDTDRFDYRVVECVSPRHLIHLLDNTKRDPVSSFLEKTRSKFGRFFSFFIGGIALFIKWLYKTLGFKITRGYKDEYKVQLHS